MKALECPEHTEIKDKTQLSPPTFAAEDCDECGGRLSLSHLSNSGEAWIQESGFCPDCGRRVPTKVFCLH